MTGAVAGRPAAFTLLVLVVLVGVPRLAEAHRNRAAATVAATVVESVPRAERSVVRRSAPAEVRVAGHAPAAGGRPGCRARSPRGHAWPPARAPGVA